jgi:S-layer homology domain
MDRQVNINISIGRRGIRAIVIALVVLALAVPVTVLASHAFTDVPNSHPFHTDIGQIKDRGITTSGCGGGNYCPEANVTRGQMAGFLNRIFSAEGTVAGYATVESNGTLAEGYARNLGTVTSSRVQVGQYSVNLGGITIRPNMAIVVTPRETFGIEQCFVFQGDANATAISIFCHSAEPGSVAADVAFTVVVFN